MDRTQERRMLGPISNFLWRILSLLSLLVGAGCMVYAVVFFSGFSNISADVRYAIAQNNYQAVGASLANAKLAGATAGIYAGLAFAFFGAGLVLQALATATEERLEPDIRARIAMSRSVPGAIVFLCAAILLGLCVQGQGATSAASTSPAVQGKS
ncbi:MAG: hypothetical protein KIS66_07995 [Fimbriimonadaceae bacterium]|nr:hypothetical protein [Fimbriimonadaceae bacterium]